MRKPFIAGNWKMNKTVPESLELTQSLKKEVGCFDKVDILICPPFTSLAAVGEIVKGSEIKLGAQNVYWQEKGAFTGEVSAQMILSLGCRFVIIGHSERRKHFFETNQEVNKKIKAAVGKGLDSIVCVGETLEEREQSKEKDVVCRQLEEGFNSLPEEDLEKISIAYEPVWAIGTGKTATGQQAEEMHGFIREWVRKTYSLDSSEKLRVLYGGSVKPDNIKDLMSQSNIDGALVGGASLKSDSFSQIIKNSVYCLESGMESA